MPAKDHYLIPSLRHPSAGKLSICVDPVVYIGAPRDSRGQGKILQLLQTQNHAWLRYHNWTGDRRTWATCDWGLQGPGLYENRDLSRSLDGSHARSIYLTPDMEQALFQSVQVWKDFGNSAWSQARPSSAFVTDVWHHVTKENLRSEAAHFLRTPTALFDAILHKNEADRARTIFLERDGGYGRAH